jgi:hypothetical protein
MVFGAFFVFFQRCLKVISVRSSCDDLGSHACRDLKLKRREKNKREKVVDELNDFFFLSVEQCVTGWTTREAPISGPVTHTNSYVFFWNFFIPCSVIAFVQTRNNGELAIVQTKKKISFFFLIVKEVPSITDTASGECCVISCTKWRILAGTGCCVAEDSLLPLSLLFSCLISCTFPLWGQ